MHVGAIQSPTSGDPATPAHERSQARSTAQALRSPLLGPERVKAGRPKKPPMPRRLSSNAQAPHRGEIFSVDDDILEVEADAAEAERLRGQQQQGYSVRRRTHLATTLPRVLSRGD